MKRTIILTLSLICTLVCVAQKCDCPKFTAKEKYGVNEIGINLYSIGEYHGSLYLFLTGNKNRVNNPFINQNFFNGLMYKHHFKKEALRIGFDYYYSKFDIEENPGTNFYYKNVGRYNIGKLRLGYERMLTTTRLQPYLAADLTLTKGQTKGYSGANGVFVFTLSPYDIRINEIGIEPAVGLKYHFDDKFSISIETIIGLAYHEQRNLEDPYYTTNHRSGLRTYINPLRLLSLNYHF